MSDIAIPGTSLKLQNIYCIGRNYAEHAKELNNPLPSAPVVFLKPTSSVCFNDSNLVIPAVSNRVDHEVEVVLVVGKSGKNISKDEAHKFISHVGVGLDFTARDLQDKAKEKSLPWSVSKGFDTFAGLSEFKAYNGNPEILSELTFSLEVNGEVRQKGHTKDMLFSIPTIIAYLSSVFTLMPGDIIYTGTPAGVTPLKVGDQMKATLDGYCELKMGVV